MTSLETPRLKLEPQGRHLFDELWSVIEASLSELGMWLPWAADPDPNRTRAYLEEAEQEWASGDERHFVILHEGRIAGSVSLQAVRHLFRRAELGYWMSTDLCGRGFMTEAASTVVAFGFEGMGLHRIELHTATENVASQRVAEKLGFQREGLMRDGSRGRDGFQDCYIYGLLATDPRPTWHLGQ